MKKLNKPRPGMLYPFFWHFVCERQNVFFRRLNGQSFPWSEDRILNNYRFLNVYRICDSTTQCLIKNVILSGSQNFNETVFRILLFRTFNRINVWERFKARFGEISIKKFSMKNYVEIIDEAMWRGERIYSDACSLYPVAEVKIFEKTHETLLRILQRAVNESLYARIKNSGSFRDLWKSIYEYYPQKYLAYQLALDINYVRASFSEMEFTVAGPLAREGIQLCFYDPGSYTHEDLIKYVAERHQQEFTHYGLNFQDLYGRPMQLCDYEAAFGEMYRYCLVSASKKCSVRAFNFNGQSGDIPQFPKAW